MKPSFLRFRKLIGERISILTLFTNTITPTILSHQKLAGLFCFYLFFWNYSILSVEFYILHKNATKTKKRIHCFQSKTKSMVLRTEIDRSSLSIDSLSFFRLSFQNSIYDILYRFLTRWTPIIWKYSFKSHCCKK